MLQKLIDDRLIFNAGYHSGFSAALRADDTSILNTRFRHCAQVMAWWRCSVVLPSFDRDDWLPFPRWAGVTSVRYLLLGANTP
jgi:hypothetical protein